GEAQSIDPVIGNRIRTRPGVRKPTLHAGLCKPFQNQYSFTGEHHPRRRDEMKITNNTQSGSRNAGASMAGLIGRVLAGGLMAVTLVACATSAEEGPQNPGGPLTTIPNTVP